MVSVRYDEKLPVIDVSLHIYSLFIWIFYIIIFHLLLIKAIKLKMASISMFIEQNSPISQPIN